MMAFSWAENESEDNLGRQKSQIMALDSNEDNYNRFFLILHKQP
jgi:hypothetical protein